VNDTLSGKIKAQAIALGFALAGVTTPDPPPHWLVFQNWLMLGRHASMRYMEDARRADPRLVMPDCRSILVLALSYPPPEAEGIAAYARGMDYHLVLKERLADLCRYIQQAAGKPVHSLAYTDTGPLLERDLAQRAGLGWIGRNTCLIHPRLGSTFFLAEVLLDLELESDAPFTADRCGTCRRCLDACPTACILPDRTLDAGRCISYLTIENRGAIPPDLRAQMGNWYFGCDICQRVCPWNRHAPLPAEPSFSAEPGIPPADLAGELSLPEQEFTRKFKISPIRRARRAGYLRNIAVVLGNRQDPAALPALERACHDEDALVSEHARWALESINASITTGDKDTA
jgi:epoxyqueuosine reductase